MDACFEKERIGTLFVWVGALEGGIGGGGGLKGVHPEKYTCRPKKKNSCIHLIYMVLANPIHTTCWKMMECQTKTVDNSLRHRHSQLLATRCRSAVAAQAC